MSSTPDNLRSSETSQITNLLTDELIKSLPAADADLKRLLRELRDTVWPLDEKQRITSTDARGSIGSDQAAREGKYQSIINSLKPEKRAVFMEHVAQMGHLRQLASLVARDNFLDQYSTEMNAPIPGTGSEFIASSNANIKQLLDSINGVTFNPVFTAHPTNNNALPSMQALGAIGRAVSAYRTDPSQGLANVSAAVSSYAKEPITPTEKDGSDHNLNASEETQNMLHFMGEIYRQLPATLGSYDEALKQKAATLNEQYDPLALQPKYKFDSWGSSGDKDGNKLVNATTTLDALLQHRAQALKFYLTDLDEVLATPTLIPESDRALLLDWRDRLAKTSETLVGIRTRFDQALEDKANKGMLPNDAFDTLSHDLAAAYDGDHGGLNIDQFTRQLEVSYPHVQGAAQTKLLGLVRGTRIFGENFGRIEFRETAEEFGRVVKMLIGNDYPLLSVNELSVKPGESEDVKQSRTAAIAAFITHLESLGTEEATAMAAKMTAVAADPKALAELVTDANLLLEEKRTAVLTAFIEDPKKIESVQAQIEQITKLGAHQAYGDSPYPIAYQTLKRMELARDFPRSIVKQVLAECQAPSNVLEAKLLMKMAGKDGREPVLGIVPLFEDPSLLATAHTTMRTIVENEAYKKHLIAFRNAHPDECAHTDTNDLNSPLKITQEVQFAHSDNGRRGGMPAARAYIYEAHENLQKLGEDLGMTFREFHGGSASDPYRGGTRSYIGMIRDYALQDSFKLTLQGGDLLNIFNYDGSIQRYLGGVLQYCARQRLKPEQHKSTKVDEMARHALMDTLKDYTHRVFRKLGIGALFGALADMFDLGAGNTGTRQQRAGVGFEHSADEQGDSTFLNPDKIRTITFSELLQHNQINPTWVGALELSNNIRKICATDLPKAIAELQDQQIPKENPGVFFEAKKRFLKALGIEQQKTPEGLDSETLKKIEGTLSPDTLATMNTEDFYNSIRGIHPGVIQYMYQRSPAFRDVMDRMAFGIATTNLSAVEFHHKAELDANPQARAFLRVLKLEYVKASTIVYAAMTGKYPEAELTQARDEAGHTGAMAPDTQGLRHDVPSDGLNMERVRDRILSLPRLTHLKRDVEDNMALLDFTNSFKDTLRREYHELDAHVLHKVSVDYSGSYKQNVQGNAKGNTLEIHIGDSPVPIVIPAGSFTSLEELQQRLGNGVDGGHEIHFQVATGSADLNVKEPKYQVRIGDAETGLTYSLPHEAWLELKRDVSANGLPKDEREEIDESRRHVFRVVHCAADTATHVYYPTAGDRAYSQAQDRLREHQAAAGRSV